MSILSGINAASLALMARVTLQLGFEIVENWILIGMFLISFIVLLRFKVNSTFLLISALVLGLVLR